MTKTIQPGQVLELEVKGLAHDGAGVARLPGDGFVFFVPGALPGERVRVEVSEVRPRSGRAHLLEILQPSPDRVPSTEAVCQVAGRCGGCSLAHLAYPAQLAFKTRRVDEALRRIGRFTDIPVSPCLASPLTDGYRNKMQYVVFRETGGSPDASPDTSLDTPPGTSQGDGFRVRLGQLAPGTHDPIPAEECRLAAPALRKVASYLSDALTAWAASNRAASASRGSSSAARPLSPACALLPRHAVLRLAAATGEVMVILVTPGPDFPGWERFTEGLLAALPEVKSVVQLVNPRPAGTVLTGRRARVAGRPHIVDRLGELTLHLSPESFLQVNPSQTARLYDLVREAAALTGREDLLDVYCGIGTIALYLAPGARHVTGIEVVPAAVEDAAATARLNGLANTEFLAGPAERLLPQLARRGHRPDVAVLDPPRAGVEAAALSAVAALRPSRLIYVSCDPETLARDLRRLADSGYTVEHVQPVDLFPQTSHVECTVALQKGRRPDATPAAKF